jgi:hypothetical protein
MQPRHVPQNTFQTWGDMGTLGTTAAATDITFETAAAIAASAVAAASASESSPEVNVSQYLVDGDLLGPKRQEHSDQGASSASQAEVEPRKSAFKQCGEPCDKVGCRLMRFKHQKRLVCTTCMPATSFKSCSQLLCKNVIHADCLLDDAIPTWTCRSCTSATVQSTHADESDDAAASIPGVNVVFGICFQCTQFCSTMMQMMLPLAVPQNPHLPTPSNQKRNYR